MVAPECTVTAVACVVLTVSPCFVSPVKSETLKFVEEELSNISMPEMEGKEGRFHYNITEYGAERSQLPTPTNTWAAVAHRLTPAQIAKFHWISV